MAQVIRFFPRQAIAGGALTIYSEVYEVAPETVQILAEYRLWAYSGVGAVSAIIETTMNSTLAPDSAWSAVGSTGVIAAGATIMSASPILRFVRGKISAVSTVSGAVLHLEGVTKDSS